MKEWKKVKQFIFNICFIINIYKCLQFLRHKFIILTHHYSLSILYNWSLIFSTIVALSTRFMLLFFIHVCFVKEIIFILEFLKKKFKFTKYLVHCTHLCILGENIREIRTGKLTIQRCIFFNLRKSAFTSNYDCESKATAEQWIDN